MSKNEDVITRVTKRLVLAMAYKREIFKDKIEGHLKGAIVHFYQAILAKKNGKTRWANLIYLVKFLFSLVQCKYGNKSATNCSIV
jgi:hypothetical protein